MAQPEAIATGALNDACVETEVAKSGTDVRSRLDARETFHVADVRPLRMGFWLRLLALSVILVWLTSLLGINAVAFYIPFFVCFVAIGCGQYLAGKARLTCVLYGLILADFVIMAASLVLDNPLLTTLKPPGQVASDGRNIYLFILIASVAWRYEPRRLLWGGVSAIIAWAGAFYYLMQKPDAITVFDLPGKVSVDEWLELQTNSCFIDIEKFFEMAVVTLIVSVILAAVAYRARKIVRAEISPTRERANPARYFAPTMAEDLATPGYALRRHHIKRRRRVVCRYRRVHHGCRERAARTGDRVSERPSYAA